MGGGRWTHNSTSSRSEREGADGSLGQNRDRSGGEDMGVRWTHNSTSSQSEREGADGSLGQKRNRSGGEDMGGRWTHNSTSSRSEREGADASLGQNRSRVGREDNAGSVTTRSDHFLSEDDELLIPAEVEWQDGIVTGSLVLNVLDPVGFSNDPDASLVIQDTVAELADVERAAVVVSFSV